MLANAGAAPRAGCSAAEQGEANTVMRYVTSLSGDTMRWMNKRRPKNAGVRVIPGHVLPDIALQLKHMFDNFDFDSSGEIDLDELRRAVKFVVDSCPQCAGQSRSVQDTKAVTDFFQTMDRNNNGVVDFVEFLAAVTTQHTEDNAIEVVHATRRLQTAFLEFATQLRRQRLAQNLHCDNLNSVQKLNCLKQLYSINYFVDSELDVQKDPVKYRKQLQEFKGGAVQSRKKKELERVRDAAALIRSKSQRQICQPPPRMASFPRVTPQGKNSAAQATAAKLRGHNASAPALPRIAH